ncbi:NTE family protein [Rhizobiales bacterium GAS191]|jgi:NTE family protein|nr:NTE family protein [Rhizobiales bacterium GAS113]SED53862.1 NTE family protein [Rhizobiales bacterium GAS188]SEE90004.1 NTE family protein [Rhizobiales bacterium GAS191]
MMRKRAKAAPGTTTPKRPSIALALGGGGARGLAHIAVLEALDEMGLRPVAIAGTSIGAIIGAAYAAGLPAARIRAHVLSALRNRTRVFASLIEARVGRIGDLFTRGNPVLIDGERLLDRFWPDEVPDAFEDLAIPFTAVATDYYGRGEVAFTSGALVSAVAASMALPGLIKPVEIAGRLLIDGGAVNPLPCDLVRGKADILIAVDVTAAPSVEENGQPSAFSTLFGAAQIMQGAIVSAKLRTHPPDLLVRPDVDGFGALDFFKAQRILDAAAPAKAKFKEKLAARLAKG